MAGAGAVTDSLEEALNMMILKKSGINCVFSICLAKSSFLKTQALSTSLQEDYSQCLSPKRDHSDISFPSKLDCFSGYPINYLVCGENHTVAVSGETESMTWAWGRYREGQLGLGEVSPSATPRPVQTLNNAPVYRLACGRRHTFAVIGRPLVVKESQKTENIDFAVDFHKNL